MSTVLALPKRAFRNVRISEIVLPDFDLRLEVDEPGLDQLGASQEEVGTLQPVLLSFDTKMQTYNLVFGGRRIRSAIRKELQIIPAFIVDDLDDGMALIMMLIENMQREALEPMEEARGMAELRDRFGLDEFQTAQKLSQTVAFVQGRLGLLRLPDLVKKMIENHELGVSQGLALTRIEGRTKTQLAIAQRALERDLSAQLVERMVDEVTHNKSSRKRMTRKHKVKRTGEPLSEAFMTKSLQQVTLRGERFLDFLEGLALSRWNPAQVLSLSEAINAVQEGLVKFQKRTAKRASESS